MVTFVVSTNSDTGDDFTIDTVGLLAGDVSDGGGLSLREAIHWANTLADPDTITFDPNLPVKTITLNGTQLTLSSELTIDGDLDNNGTADITIDAVGDSRVINNESTADTTLDGLTFTGGYSADNGGGILNLGTATITNSTLSGNSTIENGGGIFNNGIATLTNTTISANDAGSGGGIFNQYLGTAALINSDLYDNDAHFGGGIFNSGGALTLTYSTLTENRAFEQFGSGGGILNRGTATLDHTILNLNSAKKGGGIYNEDKLTLINSTLSGNIATGHLGNNGLGGGIHNTDTVTLTNSTLSGNSAALSGGGVFNGGESFGDATATLTNSTLSGNAAKYGGGIFNDDQTLSLTNSTLHGNEALFRGGGIFNIGTTTLNNSSLSGNAAGIDGGGIYNVHNATLTNSIVVGNEAVTNGPDVYGGYSDNGNNLVGGNLADIFETVAVNGIGVTSGVLMDNGGGVETIAIKSGGLAEDAGDSSNPCPPTQLSRPGSRPSGTAEIWTSGTRI